MDPALGYIFVQQVMLLVRKKNVSQQKEGHFLSITKGDRTANIAEHNGTVKNYL